MAVRRDHKVMMKGAVLGMVLGAFLPDQFNPYFVVRSIFNRG